MGKWKEKLLKKKKELSEQYQRGKIVTEQMRADKLRRKLEKRKYMEPGTIRYGLATKQSPLDLMKDSYARRKEKRKEKQKKQDSK